MKHIKYVATTLLFVMSACFPIYAGYLCKNTHPNPETVQHCGENASDVCIRDWYFDENDFSLISDGPEECKTRWDWRFCQDDPDDRVAWWEERTADCDNEEGTGHLVCPDDSESNKWNVTDSGWAVLERKMGNECP